MSTSPSSGGGYYAGYSPLFVDDVLTYLEIPSPSCIVDPWNGSGTTTEVSQRRGFLSLGYDVNPATIVIARARLLGSGIAPSHHALCRTILKHAETDMALASDPLAEWFTPATAAAIRAIERSINSVLVDSGQKKRTGTELDVQSVSPLAARFLVALFRTVRGFLWPFFTSNPTWIKSPKSGREKLRPSVSALRQRFSEAVESVFKENSPAVASGREPASAGVYLADSRKLPLEAASVDAVVTSPPYCTRIDYAIATKPELAILGVSRNKLNELRKQMIGTPVVADDLLIPGPHWGGSCLDLLERIRRHPSKSSDTYYYRNHVQYFGALWQSCGEIARVLKPNGRAVLVVQDSYYKDVHNDLSEIATEMLSRFGCKRDLRRDHPLKVTKAALNRGSQAYRKTFSAIESVLVFTRQERGPDV